MLGLLSKTSEELLTATFFTIPFPNCLGHLLRYTDAIPMKPFIAIVTTSITKQDKHLSENSTEETNCILLWLNSKDRSLSHGHCNSNISYSLRCFPHCCLLVHTPAIPVTAQHTNVNVGWIKTCTRAEFTILTSWNSWCLVCGRHNTRGRLLYPFLPGLF